MKRFVSALFILCLLAAPPAASAHPAPFSFLDVHLGETGIEATLVVHDFDLAHELGIVPPERLMNRMVVAEAAASIRTLLTPRFQIVADGRTLVPQWSEPEILHDRQSVRFKLTFPGATAAAAILSISARMFPYDPVHQTFVNVYEDGSLAQQMILNRMDSDAEYISGSRQGVLTVIGRFVPSGIHHILIGPDHLLFLVGLLLLGGTTKRLLLVVTSFTVAHSVTLSLAALNILSPPARIIEPAIALSIVYVGFDNLLVRDGRDMRTWIAFAFGFIHGFGFANVLREMELPPAALGWSLLSFNLGVEIGQVCVVLVVATLLAMLRVRNEKVGRQVAVAGSIVVIAAGAFWFVERVFL